MRRWFALVLLAVLLLPASALSTGSLTIPNTIFTQPNPVPTSLLDANYQAIASYINTREISFGLLANRPVAGTAGRFYFATDQNGGTFYGDNGTSWAQIAAQVGGQTVNQRASLTLANNGASTASILIFPGAVTSDDTPISGRVIMTLTATLTKKPGTAWAVGTNAGCLDAGASAAFTWYHVFLIERMDTGVVDVLCSTSATAPTMPANYTKRQRLGAVRTTWFPTAGAEFYFFSQSRNRFQWATPGSVNVDVNNATPGAGTDNIATLSVPNGVVVKALTMTFGANTSQIYVSALNVTAQSPGGGSPFGPIACASFGGNGGCQVDVMTDPAQRIRFNNAANVQTQITTYGWEEQWD